MRGFILRKQITITEVIGQENHDIGEDVNTETILIRFGSLKSVLSDSDFHNTTLGF